ncbi:hypothetical protein GUY60_33205 [Streptomyces sp. YC537]|uniref:IrrE N-terminal-like domain-containing protein n=1 Tax=Streptomyces boluensis TaxID=1775135 RepID=A0A964V0B1_9ACTN|nr:hypothetical protein [Streptomyces boluensis]
MHPVDLPEFPFGMWIDDGVGDRVLYRSSATGYHRDHIILHEICHLLIARDGDPATATRTTAPPGAGAHSAAEEELAETFASLALKHAGRLRPRDLSPVERRAAELLGVARA